MDFTIGVTMTREDFQGTLLKQYSESIDDLIVQSCSVYRSYIDYEQLDFRVKTILKAAKVDGLEEQLIWDLIERKVPGYIRHINSMNNSTIAKIAA